MPEHNTDVVIIIITCLLRCFDRCGRFVYPAGPVTRSPGVFTRVSGIRKPDFRRNIKGRFPYGVAAPFVGTVTCTTFVNRGRDPTTDGARPLPSRGIRALGFRGPGRGLRRP